MTKEPASWDEAAENSREKQPAPAAPTARTTPARAAAARLTRTAVARRLGCSVSKVRTLEGKVLHPMVEDGVHTFAAAEVEALAAAPPPRRAPARPGGGDAGAVAGAVFRLFDAGKDLRQVVEELNVEPEKVRALYREWRTPDLEEGERQRLRRARAVEEERELDRAWRLADKQAREHEKQISEITKAMLAYAPKK